MDPNNPTPPEDPTKIVPPVAPATPPTEPTPPATPSTEPTSPAPPAEPDLKGLEEKVSKGVIEKIGEALGLTKKETEEKIPTDPAELAKFVRAETQKGVQEVLDQQAKKEQDQVEARETQIQEGAQRFQTLWANQYNELAEAGRVPKITNKDDKNDPGNVVKVKILTKMKQIIDENEKNGIDYVPTLKEVFYENPNILRMETAAGANVPISGGGRSTTPNSGLTYDQLHKTDMDDLVKGQYES